MAAGEHHIVVDAGAPYMSTVAVTIEGVTGATMGYTAAMRVGDDDTLTLSLTEGSGITTTPSTDTVTVEIEMTAVQTLALESGVQYYQLDLSLSGTIVMRLIRGTITSRFGVPSA